MERLEYGESLPNAVELNANGRLVRHYDQAGRTEVVQYSFKGELLESTRQLRAEYEAEAQWEEGQQDALEAEVFQSAQAFDATGKLLWV